MKTHLVSLNKIKLHMDQFNAPLYLTDHGSDYTYHLNASHLYANAQNQINGAYTFASVTPVLHAKQMFCINLMQCHPDFTLKYLFNYFMGILIAKANIIVKSIGKHTFTALVKAPNYNSVSSEAYKQYRLNFTYQETENTFYLQILYKGLLHKSALPMTHVLNQASPSVIQQLIYKDNLLDYNVDTITRNSNFGANMKEAYPVITPKLEKRLNWQLPSDEQTNPYLLQWARIQHLLKWILNDTPGLNDLLPPENTFQQVPTEQ